MASKTQTDQLPPSPDLLRDLLDPALTSMEVMQRHHLDPHAYRAAVRSQAFHEAAEALQDADQERTARLTPLVHARALHTLSRIANQPTTSPSQTESARRAATALLKSVRHAEPSSRGADLQSASRTQRKPPTRNPTPSPNPLADITGDPSMTLEDSLRLIAEIEALRRATAMPPQTALDRPMSPAETPRSVRPAPAARLMARAGAAP